MKVANKSPRKRAPAVNRATLTLSLDVYRKIDELRGTKARSAWVQELVEREERKRERDQFAEALRAQYTDEVCRQTLAVNDEFPVHEQ
jgi:predicted CopG family antitoxin